MSKVYAPKPPMGALAQDLDTKHPIPPALPQAASKQLHVNRRQEQEEAMRLRAKEKARWFRDLKPTNSDYLEFTRDDVNFQVTGFRVDETHGYFECQVRAEKDGESLPLDNPYRFINPPIKVPDGTWRKEWVTGGEVIDVENEHEDIEEALRTMVYDAVVRVARSRGWLH